MASGGRAGCRGSQELVRRAQSFCGAWISLGAGRRGSGHSASAGKGTVESRGCRRYLLPNRYPYTLIYRLTPGVEVVAVAHLRRRPEYWQHR